MSEYLIQGETLTALADKIRALSGTTGAMKLDAMTTNLEETDAQVGQIDSLISELDTALDGKSVSGGSGSIETCTVRFSNAFPEVSDISEDVPIRLLSTTILNNGVIEPYVYFEEEYFTSFADITVENVICGALITVVANTYQEYGGYYEISGGVDFVSKSTLLIGSDGEYSGSGYAVNAFVFTAPTTSGATGNVAINYEV